MKGTQQNLFNGKIGKVNVYQITPKADGESTTLNGTNVKLTSSEKEVFEEKKGNTPGSTFARESIGFRLHFDGLEEEVVFLKDVITDLIKLGPEKVARYHEFIINSIKTLP